MKKKAIFIFWCLIAFIKLNAQNLKGCYAFDDNVSVKGRYFYFSLCLCAENKYYYIMETSIAADFALRYFLSSGYYSVKGDTLILNDKHHHLKMILKIKSKNTLESIKLLCVTKGLKFQLYDNTCEEDYLSRNIESFADASKVNYKTFYRPDDLKVNNNIQSGTYWGGMDLTLNLKGNGDYALRIDSIYVSKGRWGVKNDKVILYDSNFKSNFFLTIKNKTTLISALVPGDFVNSEFMLDSEIKRLHPIFTK